jgi:MFS family permease
MDGRLRAMSSQTQSGPVPAPSLRAWAAFLLGCACFGYAFLQRVAPSVMTEELMRAFQVQAGALGTLSAFYFYAYAGMQMPIGMLVDRYGAKRIMGTGMIVCLFGSLLFSQADGIAAASAGRMLIGAAVAFGYVGTMSIAATWFPAGRFSLLVGILQSVGMMGAMAGQAPLSLVVEAYGWRETMLALGGLGALLGVAIFLVVQEIPAERKAAATAAGSGAFRDVLGRRDSWCCAVLGFTLTAPMLAFAGLWAVPWLAQVHGYSRSEAATTASLVFLGWAVAGPLIGLLSGWLKRRKPILLAGLTLGAGTLALMLALPDPGPGLMRALFFLNGLAGCTMILTFTCARETNRPGRAGAALGFVNMCVVASGAILQPVLGLLLDWRWDGRTVDGAPIYGAEAYSTALSALLIAYGFGLVALLILRETRGRQLVPD